MAVKPDGKPQNYVLTMAEKICTPPRGLAMRFQPNHFLWETNRPFIPLPGIIIIINENDKRGESQ